MRISDWSSDVCSSDLAGLWPDLRDRGGSEGQSAVPAILSAVASVHDAAAGGAADRAPAAGEAAGAEQPLAAPGRGGGARRPLARRPGRLDDLLVRPDRKSTRLNSSH